MKRPIDTNDQLTSNENDRINNYFSLITKYRQKIMTHFLNHLHKAYILPSMKLFFLKFKNYSHNLKFLKSKEINLLQ